jgi:hypothetical protein
LLRQKILNIQVKLIALRFSLLLPDKFKDILEM